MTDINQPIAWDPAIDVADNTTVETEDVANPWDSDLWMPLPLTAPWVKCNPKTGEPTKFYPEAFVQRCLLNTDQYPDIHIGLRDDAIVTYDAKQNSWVTGTDRIEYLTRMAAGVLASTHVVKETIASLTSAMRRNPAKYAIDTDPWMVAFANGTLDLKAYYEAWQDDPDAPVADYMLPPSHEHHAVVYVPWHLTDNVMDSAKEYAMAFVNRIAGGDFDKVRQIMIASAMPLYGDNGIQSQMVWNYSGGSSGKSTLTTLLANLYGGMSRYHNLVPSNVTAVSVDGLDGRFDTIDLVNSAINISADGATGRTVGATALSRIKSITSGEAVHVEAKGVQGYRAAIHAKMIVNSNELPRFLTSDAGGYNIERRVHIINFTEEFRKNSPNYDAKIVSRLAKRPVIEAFLRLLIPALCEWVENDYMIPESAESRAVYAEMREKSDSVMAWVTEYGLTVDDFIDPTQCEKFYLRINGKRSAFPIWLYDHYANYTRQAGMQPVRESAFSDCVEHIYKELAHKRTGEKQIYWADMDAPRGYNYSDTKLRRAWRLRPQAVTNLMDGEEE